MLCIHYPDGTYLLIFSYKTNIRSVTLLYVLPFLLGFIWFSFFLYFPSTGFNMLPKSAYSIDRTLNWYLPSWSFSKHLDSYLTITAAEFIVIVSCWHWKNHSNRLCKSDKPFLGCIKGLKQPWKVLNCHIMSVFNVYYHQ